jgi:hypothetical protein
MNSQEINKRIAIVCGWQIHPKDKWLVIPPNSSHSVQSISTIPNYHDDLNAMHEAEKFIMDESSIEYVKWLNKFSCLWHVKASKKAEAFLRTIGQWEE